MSLGWRLYGPTECSVPQCGAAQLSERLAATAEQTSPRLDGPTDPHSDLKFPGAASAGLSSCPAGRPGRPGPDIASLASLTI
eukprot:746617-Hanusia_phi.AAC.4